MGGVITSISLCVCLSFCVVLHEKLWTDVGEIFCIVVWT